MEIFSYRTITGAAEGLYKEKGSRFLAFAYHVPTEEAVRVNVAALQKRYFDARHHCYAWVLGAEKQSYRAFDDGEPNHSAGDPILGQIRRRDLTDVLVVVVRYFGGTKLGVGGLIAAYRAAADDALNHADIVEREIVENLRLVYDYPATPEIMKLVKDFQLEIGEQQFESNCTMVVTVRLRDRAQLTAKINLMNATGTPVHFEPA